MGLRAEVAEWQTRRSQTPLRATSCGFESHLRYQDLQDEIADRAGLASRRGTFGQHDGRRIRVREPGDGPGDPPTVEAVLATGLALSRPFGVDIVTQRRRGNRARCRERGVLDAARMELDLMSTEELLQSWRDATKAAELAKRLAEVALRNAERAEADSNTAEEVATLAEDAAASAQRAAEAARAAAAKARNLATQMRNVGVADADQSVADTEAAEGAARSAYHEAEHRARVKWTDDDRSG